MDDVAGIIVDNEEIAPGFRVVRIKLEPAFGGAAPGQFVMVKVPGEEVFLRRPFSICGLERNIVTLMYKVVGRGTLALSQLGKGARLMLLGPLGKGFQVARRDVHIVVAGGIGIAGVMTLVKRLRGEAEVFFGCGCAGETSLLGEMGAASIHIATLDGSLGFRGTVVDLLASRSELWKGKNACVYACGPGGMLRGLRAAIEGDSIPCQVSVEERMACGLGLCFGCVVKTKDQQEPYKRACLEGPVFDLWELCL